MGNRLSTWMDSVRTGFWAVPTAGVGLALVLALLLVEVDRNVSTAPELAFGAGADGAREVLSAITTSMITFTGVVFSITVVVLQLASAQLSPRVLRTFFRDRITQLALGTFVATFVYTITVLRSVGGDAEDPFVPAIATTAAFVLLLGSVGMFIAFIHHVTRTIQASAVMSAIGRETRHTIERTQPADRPAPADGPPLEPLHDEIVGERLTSTGSGVVTFVAVDELVDRASEAGVLLVCTVPLGAFVPTGGALVDVHGDASRLDTDAVVSSIVLARERTLQQDVGFGLRQLVDIAERALSPGVNDPTTAVQALDQIHELLRRLGTRHLDDGLHRDADGVLRLVLPVPDFTDYVTLGLAEIEDYGAESRQVTERLRALRDDLAAAVLPEHRSALLTGAGARAAGAAPRPDPR